MRTPEAHHAWQSFLEILPTNTAATIPGLLDWYPSLAQRNLAIPPIRLYCDIDDGPR